MTTLPLESAEEIFRGLTELRHSEMVSLNDWRNILNDYIYDDRTDEFHAEVVELIVETYGDLLVENV